MRAALAEFRGKLGPKLEFLCLAAFPDALPMVVAPLGQGIDEDPEDAAIAVAIIGLAKTLGLRTLAEGIETQEQLEFLRRHGCDEGQGFLLARPMPPDMVPTWLHSVRGPAQLSLGM